MARRPVLEVDGVVYKNVYDVAYELYTAKDETGRPSRIVVDMGRSRELHQHHLRDNIGFESLVCSDAGVLALYEVNSSRGSAPNPEPRAVLCSHDLKAARELTILSARGQASQ